MIYISSKELLDRLSKFIPGKLFRGAVLSAMDAPMIRAVVAGQDAGRFAQVQDIIVLV